MWKKILLSASAMLFIAASGQKWIVINTIEQPDETLYVIKCGNGGTAKVKQMHPSDPKRQFEVGRWYVVGGSYFNYPTKEHAAETACKYAE